jgi:hypothetical protein
MEFAKCKETAITVSGMIPDSEIVYGMYSPTTPKETWADGWRKNFDPTFTHFWVEKDEKIFDHAAEQFGEPSIVITDQKDVRYVKVGRYDPKEDKTFPIVDNPQIVWDTLTGEGGTVRVVWNEYDEYIGGINELREKRATSMALL